ncbi:hypothetical protein [Vibrio parahaemolyticus]|uniref:hypothetical protein n=1 Tax=Vibrio parahaemolyticus TaxID=670 RepID=UPI000A37B94B|nr:hypothetical protein [Vibrio parahaemolyticus]MDF4625041.1 hypothetical protein [Vibrio parahaemolyticus]OUJ42300.1 hypothetical protein BTZ05_10485 [Vibrio parahaemolyticus]TOJ83021.1 hypothetical protein CGI32_17080 [Vibrio parahaemolyticus]
MSSKEHLQKHIDGLCEELNITKSPYKSNTSVTELQKIIDDLEDQLPDDNDDELADAPVLDDANDDISDGDLVDGDLAIASDSGQTDITEIPPGSHVGAFKESQLPEDAVINESGVEVSANEAGDLELKALVTIGLMSHGKRVMVRKGTTAFIEESAALDAVDEGVAVLLSV